MKFHLSSWFIIHIWLTVNHLFFIVTSCSIKWAKQGIVVNYELYDWEILPHALSGSSTLNLITNIVFIFLNLDKWSPCASVEVSLNSAWFVQLAQLDKTDSALVIIVTVWSKTITVVQWIERTTSSGSWLNSPICFFFTRKYFLSN